VTVGFPEIVPVLTDPVRGVRLRAHTDADLAAIVEQATDPSSVRFTTVPTPYGLDDARSFVHEMMAGGWERGTPLGWAIERETADGAAFSGSIDLRLAGDGSAEVGFGLHPAARGQGVMSAALRLVRDYGFDVLRLEVLRWRAVVGNWGSRRVAAAAGFRFDGPVRRLLNHRGELLDAWLATMTAEDPRDPRPWLEPPVLSGPRVVLRPFAEHDLTRIVEGSQDGRTQHWLVSLPRPYTDADAEAYLEGGREMAARGQGMVWCVADPGDDRCLGSIGLEGYANYARRGEIGYWAHPEARGRGLIAESVRLVTDFARRTSLTSFIQIRCAASNTASRGVAEAAGYRRLGVLPRAEPLGDGSVDDLVVYGRVT
jgi:RimJ/RimL family protein N-acetyltransferase